MVLGINLYCALFTLGVTRLKLHLERAAGSI